ncbi:MAG TPA: Rne/Rng family ribonuclease [Phycisphaerae bacterium]|nr:Rne/Rng family ribonuclease [Phycisphaerae bacterium]
MPQPKKKVRSKSVSESAVRPKGRASGRRRQSAEARPKPREELPSAHSVQTIAPPVEEPPPAQTSFDDSDFSAGILDSMPPRPVSSRIDSPPPQRPSVAPQEPRDRSFQAVEKVEDEQEEETFGPPPSTARDDDETFFEPAPDEIEDDELGRPPEPKLQDDSDEEIIEEAHEDAVEPQREAPADDRRDRNRRGRRGRGREDRPRDEGRRPRPQRDRSDMVEPRQIEESSTGRRHLSEEEVEPDRRPGRARRPRYEDEEEPVEPAVLEEREMLINMPDADECRIALMREGRLDELYIERASAASNVGNIYKGRVTNVEPSIQAAFIDFGLPVHGFLHISDLHPKYFPESRGENELVGRKTPRRHRPPIQTCLKRGQEVIVQVIKEGIGTKGPTLSTYISIPGRFLVMMPGMEELGVSRKIEDEDLRRKLRATLSELTLPKDMGFIVRTAGIDRSRKDLQLDLNYLTRLWSKVASKIRSEPAPAELYKESDLVIRTIRDVFDSSMRRILVDNPAVAERVREFLAIASPRSEDVVELYDGSEPLFHRYGIEGEIDKLYSKHVPLPCGGSLVIEQTEALVAIDVNSGRFRVPENAEETAYRVNQEAADEIARQLRLRDLGGLIICDFIDMLQEKHRRSIEYRLADALKKHKERAKLLRISRFGILEMTRQRQRPSFSKSMFADCPRCGGSGRVKATESMSLDIMRQIALAAHKEGVVSVDVRVAVAVANELQNRKRHQITDLERAASVTIRVHGEPAYTADQAQIVATDRRGREVPGFAPSATPPRSPAPQRFGQSPPSDRRPEGQHSPAAGDGGRRGGGRRRGRRGGRGRGGNRGGGDRV